MPWLTQRLAELQGPRDVIPGGGRWGQRVGGLLGSGADG